MSSIFTEFELYRLAVMQSRDHINVEKLREMGNLEIMIKRIK